MSSSSGSSSGGSSGASSGGSSGASSGSSSGALADGGANDGSAEDASAADAGDPLCRGGIVGTVSRPATVRVPSAYDCSKPSPLVMLLHDYASTGAAVDAYFGFSAVADSMGFIYVHPDGTMDSAGNQFWNATDACCNIDNSTVDDDGYLSDVLYQIVQHYNVDSKRVYVVGYGNGGFMAYRLACDHSVQISAVADLGGAMWGNASKCVTDTYLSALEIHGTSDATFAYGGGTNLDAGYPSAQTTIGDWVTEDDCTGTSPEAGASLDLDSTLAGAETTVQNWPSCPAESGMALWSIQGGTHTPTFSTSFTPTLLGYLFAHVRP